GTGAGIHGTGGLDLQTAVKLWPTPRARDGQAEGFEAGLRHQEKYKSMHLTTAVKMFPTPMTRDWKSGRVSAKTLAKNSRPLNEFVAQGKTSGQLNAEFVEWLMGFPRGWTEIK